MPTDLDIAVAAARLLTEPPATASGGSLRGDHVKTLLDELDRLRRDDDGLQIVRIEGDDLAYLLDLGADDDPAYIRVAFDEGTFKLKVQEGPWTRPLGERER